MTTLNSLERYLQLDLSYNVRDVGGSERAMKD